MTPGFDNHAFMQPWGNFTGFRYKETFNKWLTLVIWPMLGKNDKE